MVHARGGETSVQTNDATKQQNGSSSTDPKSKTNGTIKPDSDEVKPVSQFSLGVFLIKFVVIFFDVITFPIYWLIQQPWVQLEKQRKVKAVLENPSDPYSSYVRVTEAFQNHYIFKAQTIPELQQLSYKLNPKDNNMFGRRRILDVITEVTSKGKKFLKYRLSDYEWFTNQQANTMIDDLASGFLTKDVKHQELVLMYAETRMEWFLCAQALFRIGAVLTTLYTTLGLKSISLGIQQTEVEKIVTTLDLLPHLLQIIDQIPTVKKIFVIDQHPGLLKGDPVVQEDFNKALEGKDRHVEIISYEHLMKIGYLNKDSNQDYTRPKPEDLALILYTSGSTGAPKGAVFTHANFIASCQLATAALSQEIIDDYDQHVFYGVLPLAHIFEMIMEVEMYSLGVRIGYGSPHTMSDASTAILPGQKGDLKMLRPTFLAGVPLLLDRMRKLITDRFERKKSVFWKQLIKFSIAYKNYWYERGFQTPLINNFICKRLNGNLGGNVQFMVCGGAPLSPDTHRMMRALLNIEILVGYGSTETGGSTCLMDLHDRSVGTVGSPLHRVKMRLKDWEEGGYSVHDKPFPRGEIVVGSESVAMGYYKLPDLTREAFEEKDGIRWFHTGDIGEVDNIGAFRIIDRKKDLVKLQFGEYIALGKVEAELKNLTYVDNVLVYGDSYHCYVIALIQPSRAALKSLAEDLGKSNLTFEELCDDPEIIAHVLKELKEFCAEAGLHKMEIPQKIKLCKEEWTLDNGLLTASMKIKRKEIQKFYQKYIDELYKDD